MRLILIKIRAFLLLFSPQGQSFVCDLGMLIYDINLYVNTFEAYYTPWRAYFPLL